MNFADLFTEHRIPFRSAGQHHHATGGWCQVDCKQCSPNSGHYRLGFHEGGWCSCWVCGRQWLVKALADVLGVTVTEAKRLAGGLERTRPATERALGRLVMPAGVGPLLPIHRCYLKDRGFNPDHLESFWGLKAIGVAAELAWRLWLPVHHRGEIVSWTTRAVREQKAKYVNAKPGQERMPAKWTLPGLDHCRHAVVLVEGLFDAYRIGPGAAATMGVNVTREQVLLASRFPVRVVCFDADVAGRRAAARLCGELAPFPGKTVDVCLDADDPGSASKKEIGKLRKAFLD